MIVFPGVSKSKPVCFPLCRGVELFVWHGQSSAHRLGADCAITWVWYEVILSSLCLFVCSIDNVHVGLHVDSRCGHMAWADVCLLKGPIDRPEAWAFPAEQLLTALTVLLGAACQQLPLSIKQRLQVSTDSGGEQGSLRRSGGTDVPPLGCELSPICCCLFTGLTDSLHAIYCKVVVCGRYPIREEQQLDSCQPKNFEVLKVGLRQDIQAWSCRAEPPLEWSQSGGMAGCQCWGPWKGMQGHFANFKVTQLLASQVHDDFHVSFINLCVLYCTVLCVLDSLSYLKQVVHTNKSQVYHTGVRPVRPDQTQLMNPHILIRLAPEWILMLLLLQEYWWVSAVNNNMIDDFHSAASVLDSWYCVCSLHCLGFLGTLNRTDP